MESTSYQARIAKVTRRGMASRLGVSREATSQFKRMGTMELELVSRGILLPDHF